MVAVVFWGLLIPFFVSSLGTICVFFLKRSLGDRVSESDQLLFWRHGSRIHSEFANPRYGAVRLGGDLGLSTDGHWFWGRYSFSAWAGSSDPGDVSGGTLQCGGH